MAGAREILLVWIVDDRGLAGDLDAAALDPGYLGGEHFALDCEGDGQVRLGGDVQVDALELRGLLRDLLEQVDNPMPVARDFDPDLQVHVSVSVY